MMFRQRTHNEQNMQNRERTWCTGDWIVWKSEVEKTLRCGVDWSG
jgi:hypothetical protein